jgi:hypothetical protein
LCSQVGDKMSLEELEANLSTDKEQREEVSDFENEEFFVFEVLFYDQNAKMLEFFGEDWC